jgi:hypothetical protein
VEVEVPLKKGWFLGLICVLFKTKSMSVNCTVSNDRMIANDEECGCEKRDRGLVYINIAAPAFRD